MLFFSFNFNFVFSIGNNNHIITQMELPNATCGSEQGLAVPAFVCVVYLQCNYKHFELQHHRLHNSEKGSPKTSVGAFYDFFSVFFRSLCISFFMCVNRRKNQHEVEIFLYVRIDLIQTLQMFKCCHAVVKSFVNPLYGGGVGY